MSNEKNTLDELFKNKLGEYSLDVPEHVWKNIEAKRTPLYRAVNLFKSKRGVAVSAVLLLAVAATAFWATTALQPAVEDKATQLLATNTVEAAPAKVPAATVAQSTNSTASSTQNNVQAQPATTAPTTVAHQTVAAPANSQTNNTQQTTATTTTSGNDGNNDNSTNTADNTANTNNTTNTNTQSDNSFTQNESTTVVPAQNDNNNTATGIDESTANTETALAVNNNANTATEGESIEGVEGLQKTAVKPDNAKTNKFSFDAYTSLDFAGRHLSANGVGTNYIDAKKQAEKFTPGYSAGLRVNYDYKKIFKVRVGLQYSLLNEKLNYNNQTKYTRIDTLIGYQTDPNTGVTKPVDTAYNTVNGTNTISANAKNTYTFIDVPVQIELPLYKTDKLNLFVTGGAALNLRFSQRGMQLNRDLSGTNEINSANPYKTTAGLTLLGGLGMEYKCCQNSPLSLLLEATYRHGTGNVFGNNAGMVQNYRILSGSVGLRYRF